MIKKTANRDVIIVHSEKVSHEQWLAVILINLNKRLPRIISHGRRQRSPLDPICQVGENNDIFDYRKHYAQFVMEKRTWREKTSSNNQKKWNFMLQITCAQECVAFRIYRCASLIDTIENAHTNQVAEMHMKRTQKSTFKQRTHCSCRCWMSFSVRTIESFENSRDFLCAREAKRFRFWIGCCMIYIERFCDSREGGLCASRNSSDVQNKENASATATNSCNQWMNPFLFTVTQRNITLA